jgi:hypothetical protein
MCCIFIVILTIRVWAVWERRYNITIFLSIFCGIVWVSGFVIMGLWIKTLKSEFLLAAISIGYKFKLPL